VDRRKPIQAVTFDVGGTLIDPWPSVGHVYAAVAAEHGLTGVDPESLNVRFAAASSVHPNSKSPQASIHFAEGFQGSE
jgi:phosphoglycolate phosphatase-like HAD superfamily hydrolase